MMSLSVVAPAATAPLGGRNKGRRRRGRSLPRGGRLGGIPIKLSHRSGSSGKGASAAHPPPRCRRRRRIVAAATTDDGSGAVWQRRQRRRWR